MVRFTHDEVGTAEALWAQAEGWSGVGSLDLDDVARLLVVAAHPDDESLGAGGLVAAAVASGIPISLVIATDGEASHPMSPTLAPAALAAMRRLEARDAAQLLGADVEIHLLGLPDGELAAHTESLRANLERLLGERGAAGTVVVAPWRGDGHTDHEAAGHTAHAAAATAGVRLLEYPIWMWHWARPDSPEVPWARMTRFDLPRVAREAKRAAILAHRSQIAPLSAAPGDEVMLAPDLLAHFERPYEVFVDSAPATRDGSASRSSGQPETSLDAAFFDDFYASGPDPWGYETRWYEERKRAVTLAALPRPRFRRALELGCSIGVLTAELATRCDTVLGVDVAEAPLRAARRRLAGHTGVELLRLGTPREWPTGAFDLVVLSEVGYYWDAADLAWALERSVASLTPEGILLACHWRHPVAEYPLDGDAVHAALGRIPGMVRTVRHIEEDFVLEVYRRPPGASVARETGLI